MVNYDLFEEVFGLFGVIVIVKFMDQMIEVVYSFVGQLICMLYFDDDDVEDVCKLLLIFECKVGCVLVNGFLIGVEVCDSMVYGGFYLVFINFGVILVGIMVICWFFCFVSY